MLAYLRISIFIPPTARLRMPAPRRPRLAPAHSRPRRQIGLRRPEAPGTRDDESDALCEVAAVCDVPKGVSAGMVEQVQWNVQRLLAGGEISRRKR